MSKQAFQDIFKDEIDREFKSLVESLTHDAARSILGLKPGHNEEDLKSAYRDASKKHHPDVGGNPDSMKHVNAAYEKLKGSGFSHRAEQGGDPIFNAIRHPDRNVRAQAIQHPNVQHHHIDHALKDPDYWVRHQAVSHPSAQPHHIDKALDDEDWTVSQTAMEHPNATHENISKGLKHEDDSVRERAIGHPNSRVEHIDTALNDEYYNVRLAAIKHPKVTIKHIEKGLHDEDEEVRGHAIEHLRKKGVFSS